MTPLDKWLAVVLTTINPLTGRGAAIPLGIGLGLPLLWVAVVSGVSNLGLAAAIILFIDRLERVPVIKTYIEKKRGKKLTRFIQSKGLFYAVTIGPLVIGTFTVVLVFQALGADRKRMLLYCLISGLIVTPIVAWVSPVIVYFLKDYEQIFRMFQQ